MNVRDSEARVAEQTASRVLCNTAHVLSLEWLTGHGEIFSW